MLVIFRLKSFVFFLIDYFCKIDDKVSCILWFFLSEDKSGQLKIDWLRYEVFSY